jgi:DNA polymerase I-like protein with 3'-5' exonuclease and polymerase domains
MTALLQARGHDIARVDAATMLALESDDSLLKLLLAYREAKKQAGTYGEKWLKQFLHPVTGRVHADYKQLGSVAGRMSCTKPNMQNLPRSPFYRSCIAAPPGSCFIKADYSQIELRIAAVKSGDPTMLKAYHEGKDLHILTASRVLGIAPEAVTPDQRQLAKALNSDLSTGWALRGFNSTVRPATGWC